MTLLTREQLLARRPAVRDVPLDDGTVRVRELSAREMRQLRETAKGSAFSSALIAASVIDEAGALVLQPEDVAALEEIDNDAYEQLLGAALDLNGFAESLSDVPTSGSSGA